MDFYAVLKLVHVLGAVAWVGGGGTLVVAAIVASARNDDAGTASVLATVVALSNIWFIPTSLVTVLAGVGMAVLYGLWSEAWIIIGLVGFAMTFTLGVADQAAGRRG